MAMRDAHVLIVAGSDSSGGAGIVRDIETVAAHGLKSCVAITAVTVQTHRAVTAIEPVAVELVGAQMLAALESNPVAAIKIGMLGTGETLAAVAGILRRHPDVPVVLDPVLAASSGGGLLAASAIEQLRSEMFPLCTLITPNLPELARLTGRPLAQSAAEGMEAGSMLLASGAQAVLIKGGHATGDEAADILIRNGMPARTFTAPRLAGTMRGTGCMMASAIASQLASGETLEASVELAKDYVSWQLTLNAG